MMAHDRGEGTMLLQHTQRVNHCEFKVNFETGTGQEFSIILQFTFIAPNYILRPLQVSGADETGAVQEAESVTNRSPEIEAFSARGYARWIMLSETRIDQFRAELRLEDRP